MPVTVIVGGQYGSEGKGKVAHWLAHDRAAAIAIRTGGPNAGHTVIDDTDTPLVLRQLPTAAILPDVICVLGAGAYIDLDILFAEISKTNLSEDRLIIDPNAVIICERDKEREREIGLGEAIGSTQSGTGAAVVRRIERSAATLARNEARIAQFVHPTAEILREHLSLRRRIILEGTQGFGLSVLHSPEYPYVTSRDTTAAGFVSEAGLSPLDVDEIVLVVRAFPIRVSGHSGPLPHEIDWRTVSTDSDSPTDIVEYTSVTTRVRRVARFDAEIVRAAIAVNSPTHLVLNHLDYVDYACRLAGEPTQRACEFLNRVESKIGRSIDYLGFDPLTLYARSKPVARVRFA